MSRVHMHLTDGRVLDLSDLTTEQFVERIRAEGITPDQVVETRHYVHLTRCEYCGEAMPPQRSTFVPNPHPKRFCSARHRALAFLARRDNDDISPEEIERRFQRAKAQSRATA